MGEKNPYAGPIRRTEIPIYLEDVQRYQQEAFANKIESHKEPFFVRKFLDDTFNTVNQQITDFWGKYHDDYKNVQDKVNTGIAHAGVTLDYLRQEENDLPRAGAVAMAGVAGLVLGLRGGFMRKLLYTSVAASGMAGLCYPQQAVLLSKDLVSNSKKYAAIGYNFVYGVKPNDNVSSKSEVSKSVAASPLVTKNKKQVVGDIGQSNPEDKDLYTTRT